NPCRALYQERCLAASSLLFQSAPGSESGGNEKARESSCETDRPPSLRASSRPRRQIKEPEVSIRSQPCLKSPHRRMLQTWIREPVQRESRRGRALALPRIGIRDSCPTWCLS